MGAPPAFAIRRQCNIVSVTGYRLRPVHDQRERDERAKRGELAAAVGDVRAADERLAVAAARVRELREILSRPHEATTIAELERLERYRARLRGQLEQACLDELHAQEARDGVAASADAARGRLAIARAARKVIEAHFARWRDDQRKLAERRED